MISHLEYYARCNRKINGDIIEILSAQKEDLFNREIKGYFKSIGDILEHVYSADLRWLSDFRTAKPFSFSSNRIFDSLPEFGKRYIRDLADFKPKREEMDRLYALLVSEIAEGDFGKTIGRTNRQGQKQEVVFWKALIHAFNHQTHHRGQISQILDELGIENNYSNMIYIG